MACLFKLIMDKLLFIHSNQHFKVDNTHRTNNKSEIKSLAKLDTPKKIKIFLKSSFNGNRRYTNLNLFIFKHLQTKSLNTLK